MHLNNTGVERIAAPWNGRRPFRCGGRAFRSAEVASSIFTSRDPFEGMAEQPYSQHPYQYALSDPVLYGDPSGRWCVQVPWTNIQVGTTCADGAFISGSIGPDIFGGAGTAGGSAPPLVPVGGGD